MIRLINVHFFKGWTRRERREFWISLLLTVVFCAALVYAGTLLCSSMQKNNQHDIINIA